MASTSNPESLPAISLSGISKCFGSMWANRDISLEIFAGEVHAIVGENGAGKSTLMKILYGSVVPDSGEIRLGGMRVRFRTPRDAIKAGIGMVHQQLLIFPQLSALENIVVGFEPQGWGLFRRKATPDSVPALCKLFGFDLPLDATAGEISYAQRQQIELLRVLYRGAKILILDEPTSLLAPPEVTHLLDLLGHLKARGHTIIFISHRLPEVFAVADRISILRRGRMEGTYLKSETAMEQVVAEIISAGPEDMTGNIESITGERGPTRGNGQPSVGEEGGHPGAKASPLIVLDRLTARAAGHEADLRDFDLEIFEGETLGIGGVVGNGQRTLARVLAGAGRVESGRILLKGRDITSLATDKRIRNGIRWLPANAQEEASLPALSLWENLLLDHRRDMGLQRYGWLVKDAIMRWAEDLLRIHKVVYNNVEDSLLSLSGGNQQKVLLARVLCGSPALVILEQPGRGLDIQSRKRLHGFLRDLNSRGTTVLVLSHDLDELISICRRIGILYRGRMMGVVAREEACREELGGWMLGTAAS